MPNPLEKDNLFESPYFDLHDGHIHALARVRQIRRSISPDSELLSLFVVNLATAVEWFTRSTIKNLIDFAPDHINEEAKIIRELKLNYAAVMRTHKNRFSIGDLVALNRNFSSFDDVKDTLFDLVSKPKIGLAAILKNQIRLGVIKERTLTSQLNRMFNARHEIVHGSPRHLMYKNEFPGFISDRDLLIYCACIERFFRQFGKFMQGLRSFSDRSTLDMRISQSERLETTDQRIAELEAALMSRLDKEAIAELLAAQNAWRAWRDCEAEFQTHIWRGGTFRNVARLGEATSIGIQRIRQLEFLLREFDNQI